ncbi:neuronal acetylcholine receptor subunit alpha-7 [Drosophila guanche]|uniref:neuronal acetylcholine receptor subunit alpha-7 n=1 Tax=Drosophila guanche TaxID=7266 RepID=UPI0014725ADC|nr:neuronal acetylcholine receptor subunit alpha-7 [Drosophila guanche]
MKNAQLKLSDVDDDDELWLAVRLAQCSNSSRSRSNKNNQQLSQLQLRSLSKKNYSTVARQNVACKASNNGQQQSLGSNMLSPQAAAAVAVGAAAPGATKETVSTGNHATTQQQTNIRLCARKRQRMRRRRKRKPEIVSEAAEAEFAQEFTTATQTKTKTETEIVETSSNINISNNLWPIATYMQCRSSNNPSIMPDISPATFSCLLQVLFVSVQQRAEVLLRGIVSCTTVIISYLNRIATLLRRRGSQSSSNQSNSNSSSSSSSHSSSAKIINGLNKHSWIFLLIYLNLSAKVCLAGYHEKRLLHDLLDPYNTLERPVLNESDPLQLSFGLTLMQIIDVDEKNQLLVTNVWLKLEWNDMNLRWNTSDYGGVKDLRIPPHRIWKPDVLMYNSADEGFDGTYQTNVVVRNNGSCLYVPPGIFKSTCKIDITWFPFDDQRCEMKFGSWTYDGFQLDLQLQDETGGDISSYVLNGEWELLGVPGKRNEIYYNCCPEPYIDITFAIIIRRRTLYYFFNLIIPCVLIASMALLGFTLPPDSGEKLSLGVTILLSLTVFLNMVAETMPATSDAVPLLGTYFNCIMFMVASSVVSTILILNYHHRNADTHEMSEWIRIVFLCWLPWILRMSRPGRPLILEFPTTPCSDTSSERKHQILSDVELKERSSKSLLANVLDIDDDFRHNCRPMTPGGTLPHNPAFYRTVYGQGDDGSIGPIGSTRMPDAVSHHTCIKSSTEYELGLILKEIRFITDQLRKDDESNDIANDWKFAAMVVDRLCLIIFTMFTILATIAVLLSAPHIIVS